MYLLISFIVALGSVFGLSLVGALMTGEHKTRTATIGFFCAIGYWLLLYWIQWGAAIGIYGPGPLFGSIFFGAIIGAIIGASSNNYESAKGASPGLIISIGYLLYIIIIAWFFQQTDIFQYEKKAKLIGTVAQPKGDLSQTIEPMDPAFICLVPEVSADVKANSALSGFKVTGYAVPGSRYKIGKATKQYIDGQLWWIYPLEFHGWLKWRQDKQVPGYLRVSAQDPFQDAQAVQVNKQGQEIHIKYLNSACYEYRADRYLRYNGYMNMVLDDWTFEVDDNWNPYYTVSVLERTTGYSGLRTKGVVVLNLQTGENKYYSINEAPVWIDRIQPLDVLDFQAKKWGEYVHSSWWYNFLHNDKSQVPTPGWFLTYSKDGYCQWFSGFTSTNSEDHALTGFILIDSRLDKATFYKAKGVTEAKAYETALSLWNNFTGYEPTELVPCNLYGTLTYVIPMVYAGQFKGVSLVSMENYEINAKGNTLEEAISNYRAKVNSAPGSVLAPVGGKLATISLRGKVVRVGQPMLQGQQQIFPFAVAGANKIFQVVYSYEKTPKAPFVAVGEEVAITYLDTKEKVITCQTFDIPSFVLSDESPAQARYLKNKGEVKGEVDRLKQEERRSDLLQDSRLKKANPDDLEKFLEKQK
ncbi:MAG: hypothetical protein PHT40_03500 [Patescibacteria group bacterium]|nr:hypothetical protein [Patescibacteria group bacterium]